MGREHKAWLDRGREEQGTRLDMAREDMVREQEGSQVSLSHPEWVLELETRPSYPPAKPVYLGRSTETQSSTKGGHELEEREKEPSLLECFR